MNIQTNNAVYSGYDVAKLQAENLYREASILRFFKYRFREAFTELEVRQTLHINVDVIRRSLFQLSAKNPTAPWRDLKGQAPLKKLKSTRYEPRDVNDYLLYQWNQNYSRSGSLKQGDLFNFFEEASHVV